MLEHGLEDAPDVLVELLTIVDYCPLRRVALELEHVSLETIETVIELTVQETPRVFRTEFSLNLIRSDQSTQSLYSSRDLKHVTVEELQQGHSSIVERRTQTASLSVYQILTEHSITVSLEHFQTLSFLSLSGAKRFLYLIIVSTTSVAEQAM